MPKRTVKRTILIIDDEISFCKKVQDSLSDEATLVLVAHSGAQGITLCSQQHIDVVLLDQNLPDMEGENLCPIILKHHENAQIIFMSAHPSFAGSVKAIRAGAHDYLSKPIGMEELSLSLAQATTTLSLEKIALLENYRSQKESAESVVVDPGEGLVEVMNLVDRAAACDAPVLITGEAGTGKTMIAKTIHYKSAAQEGAFIHINCAELPNDALEAELFGFQKGDFPQADNSRRGVFEIAEGGTLCLDEIQQLSPQLQKKLLEVLQEKKVRRMGRELSIPVDFRLIAVTMIPLEELKQKFIQGNLFYLLSVIRIHMPPLRERRQDIGLLCNNLLKRVSVGGEKLVLPKEEIMALMSYDWPGNIRELRNILERAVILRKGTKLKPSELLLQPNAKWQPSVEIEPKTDIMTLGGLEKQHVRWTMKRHHGNKSQTAETLGIALSTLKRKLKHWDADGPD